MLGLQDRQPGSQGSPASDSGSEAASDATDPVDQGAPPWPERDGAADGATPKSEVDVLLAGQSNPVFALGETRVFTVQNDVRTRLVAVDKAPPHRVAVLHEEDIFDGIHISGVATARGRVFFVFDDGALHSIAADGTDGRVEQTSPGWTAQAALSAPTTLWLVDPPRVAGDDMVFEWYGQPTSNIGADAGQISAVGTVAGVAADDEALVYTTVGASPKVYRWVPFGAHDGVGLKELASPAEAALGVGLDGSRVFAFLRSAAQIVAYDRTTGQAMTVLSNVRWDGPPLLRSDGTRLYMLTETTLRKCVIAQCEATLEVIAQGLVGAQRMELDADNAYFATFPEDAPGLIGRVRR